jgi:hypothetical protein
MSSGDDMSCEQYCNSDARCRELCCDHDQFACDKVALNPAAALSIISSPPPSPRLKLAKTYYLYLRDNPPNDIKISNAGDESADVTVTAFDEHVDIKPTSFPLAPTSSQTLKVSFKREPFIRQIYKFAITARKGDKIVDRTEFHVEYIPKR